MTCSKCGNNINEFQQFCDKCGTPVSQGPVVQPQIAQQPVTQGPQMVSPGQAQPKRSRESGRISQREYPCRDVVCSQCRH